MSEATIPARGPVDVLVGRLEDARWESVIEWRETHAAAISAAREEW